MSVRSNEGVFCTIYDHVFTVSFHDFKMCNICKYINFLNVNLLKSKSIHFFMNIFRGQEVIFMASSLSAYKIIGCLMLYHVHVYCRLLFIYSSIVITRFMAIMLSLLIHAHVNYILTEPAHILLICVMYFSFSWNSDFWNSKWKFAIRDSIIYREEKFV